MSDLSAVARRAKAEAQSGTTLTPPPDFASLHPGYVSSLGSGRLRGLFRLRGFHRAHVEVEQAFALVALVLVLLTQLDDLLKDLHIKSFALGLRKHFLLLLVQLSQFAVDVLDPLDERTNPAAGNGDVRHGASLFNEVVKMPANK